MLDRRRFLTGAGAVAAVAWTAPAIAGCSGPAGGGAAPAGSGAGGSSTIARVPAAEPLLGVAAAQSPIGNVVLLMMENRSFDHWMGWLAGDQAYLEAGRRRYGRDFNIEGDQGQTFPSAAGGEVTTEHMMKLLADGNPYRGCDHPDPGHSWSAGRVQRDGGFLAKGSGNDPFATGYYLGADLPFTSKLATRFTVCDRSHASVLGPTFPNREYFLSAQSGINKTNALPTGDGFPWENIVDRLVKAGVTVKGYYSDLPVVALWGPRMAPYVAKVDEFFTDAASGKLPMVSFVDPAFVGGNRTDNHPQGDIRAGERFVRDVFTAYATSPHWGNGLFVLTYDEWGGFFDHVKPPTFPDDRASTDDQENFGQAGFRVPTILASPYAQPGFADHQVYDHTSILRFLEWRFLGAPPEGSGGSPDWSLTARDRNANNIGSSLVTAPQNDVGFDLAVSIDQPSPDCGPGSATGLSFGIKHDFELARDAGFFERVGFDPEPSSMLKEWV